MDKLSYVGVDVAKRTLELALGPDAKSCTVENSRPGIQKILQRQLKSFPPGDTESSSAEEQLDKG